MKKLDVNKMILTDEQLERIAEVKKKDRNCVEAEKKLLQSLDKLDKLDHTLMHELESSEAFIEATTEEAAYKLGFKDGISFLHTMLSGDMLPEVEDIQDEE